MTITRRGFMKSILALGAAPAICWAESLMKIWTPPQALILPTYEGAVEGPQRTIGELVLSWYEQQHGIWVLKERLVTPELMPAPFGAIWQRLEVYVGEGKYVSSVQLEYVEL